MGTNRKSGPQLACEITPDRVIAARATHNGTELESYTARALPAGIVVPRLAETNVTDAERLKQAVTDALATVGAASGDIVAVLPDASVRITLLDFDTLPEKKQEADAVVRFRLKKVLPFDVEEAAVSYDVHRTNGKVQVVAAVALATVVAEYETIFRDLGYSPGVVLPSTLAALGTVDSSEPVLVIKSDTNTTTLAITSGDELMLFRTLENQGGDIPSADQLAQDVYASLVFFQDSYNTQVDRILLGGLLDKETAGATLEAQTGARVQNLVDLNSVESSRLNFSPSILAGVAGALLG